MTRILFHHRIRADDGQAVHVREIIGALREAGHEVLECALVPKAAVQQADAAPSMVSRILRGLNLPRRLTEVMEIAYTRKGEAMLLSAARDFKPDFIYERHALHCAAGLRAARKIDVPLLLEVNSPMCVEMTELGALRFPGRARRTEREVLSSADRVLPVSGVLADILQECGAPADRIRIIRNGADPRRYSTDALGDSRQQVRGQLGLGDGELLLGFVGYMRPWHRLDLVLEVLARPELAHVHFMLIGEGPALPAIVAASQRQGLSGRLHAVGRVGSSELPKAVCAFDLALIPAINRYASPLKLFDSLAAGVCTLAPDQPNLREMIHDGDNGILFARDDAQDLGRRLTEVCADAAELRAIGARGRDTLLAEEWTWAGNARRVIEAFEEVAGAPQAVGVTR